MAFEIVVREYSNENTHDVARIFSNKYVISVIRGIAKEKGESVSKVALAILKAHIHTLNKKDIDKYISMSKNINTNKT